MNKLPRQYVIQDLDGELVLVVTAKTEDEAVARFVQWYENEEIPGYEDLSIASFDALFSVSEVQSI